MRMLGICNASREAFVAPTGITDAVEACAAIDVNRGQDTLRPRYKTVSELRPDEQGYLVYDCPDDLDDSDYDAVMAAIDVSDGVTYVHAAYTI